MALRFGVTKANRANRKALRRQSAATAWIRVEKQFAVRACTVVDISLTGVQLTLHSPEPLAREFRLLLSRDSQGRACHLKWRQGASVGAEFR